MELLQNDINNLSYTSKDFESIYPELLDLVKKLTNKWDPTTSNESDPGVVLVKLMALMADKNDYNIDKNILETFPISVTQPGNARKLYSQLGYNMKWYQSAVTRVTFTTKKSVLNTYTNDNEEVIKLTSPGMLKLERFNTMLTDDSGELIYTLIEPVTLSMDELTKTAICIQGTVQRYVINNSTIITLNNLDENNRLYFSESHVAENGVFIYNVNYDEKGNALSVDDLAESWVKVDNLAIQPSGKLCYSFGVLPNSNTCYLQFPADIAKLIGGGLNIYYVLSSGADGTVGAGSITRFYSDNELPLINIDVKEATVIPSKAFIVNNLYGSTPGKDPEPLSEAYSNYKRTVGTFNTLVSCRDYENYIYNLKNDDTDNYLVSNVRVADRTNDLNDTVYIMTLDEDTNSIKKLVTPIQSTGDDLLTPFTPFQLRLYLLNQPYNIDSDESYNASFVQAPNNLITNNTDPNSISFKLQDVKSIQHEYNLLDDNDYLMVKNFCNLTGNIITYYSVTAAEAEEIENKVKQALRNRFNSHQLEWGKALDYDTLVDTIQNADDRIKAVILNEPVYDPYLLKANKFLNSYEGNLDLTDTQEGGALIPLGGNDLKTSNPSVKDAKFKFTARMIEAGNVDYFDFDHDFNYDFGQILTGPDQGIYKGIKSIQPGFTEEGLNFINTTIDTPENMFGYTLPKNQNIYLYAPAFKDTTQYSTYVNYRVGGTWQDSNGILIPANTTYTLQGDQKLFLAWKQDGELKGTTLKVGSTIKVNFPLRSNLVDGTPEANRYIKKDYSSIGLPNSYYRVLSASETITEVAINSELLAGESTSLSCLCLTHNKVENGKDGYIGESGYVLMSEGQAEYVLKTDEYFIYTNSSKSILTILGAGTRLSRYNASPDALNRPIIIPYPKNLTLSNIQQKGLSAIGDGWWIYQPKTFGDLTATEMQITTLGEGANLKKINEIINLYSYTETPNSEVKYLPNYNNVLDIDRKPIEWIRDIRLNLVSSPDNPQQIRTYEQIIIKAEETPTGAVVGKEGEIKITGGANLYFALSQPISIAGGETPIDLGVIINGETQYILNGYAFSSSSLNDGTQPFMRAPGSFNTYSMKDLADSNPGARDGIGNFTYLANTSYLICLRSYPLSSGELITITPAGRFKYKDYNTPLTNNSEVTLTPGVNTYIYVRFEQNTLLNIFGALASSIPKTTNLVVSNIYKINGISNQLKETFGDNLGDSDLTDLNNILDKALELGFNPINDVKAVDKINTELYGENKGLFDAQALWDPNNILNKYTLPQLNLNAMDAGGYKGYNIKVAKSSLGGA